MVVPATDACDQLGQDTAIVAIVNGPANAHVSLPGRTHLGLGVLIKPAVAATVRHSLPPFGFIICVVNVHDGSITEGEPGSFSLI